MMSGNPNRPPKMCRNNSASFSPTVERLDDGTLLLVLPHLNARQKSIARHTPEARLAAISLLLATRRSPGKGRAVLMLADGRKVDSAERLVALVAQSIGISPRSLWRWQKAFLAGGVSALMRHSRSDKGRSRLFAKWPQLRWICMKHLAAGKSIRATQKLISHECQGIGIPTPSYTTLRSYVPSERTRGMKP